VVAEMNRKAKLKNIAISSPKIDASGQRLPVLLFDIGNVFLHM